MLPPQKRNLVHRKCGYLGVLAIDLRYRRQLDSSLGGQSELEDEV